MAITLRTTKGTALTHAELDANFTTLQSDISALSILDSSDVTAIAQALDSAQSITTNLNQLAGDSDVDFGTHKLLYSNNYATTGDLPDATTYHGMFAHVHAEGRGYFAHGGVWLGLANESEIASGIDSAATVALIDSAYINFRVDEPAADSIGGLTNVNMSGVADGKILKWDAGTSKFIIGTDLTSSGSGGIALSDLSVSVAAAGSANLSYNDGTGIFTYTPPDLSSYLTAETNDLSSAVTWANIPDANVPETAVTQHQAALSITESQISDLQTYLTTASASSNYAALSGAVFSGAVDLNGYELILDIDGDTSFRASTDDKIDIKVLGSTVGYFDSTGIVVDAISTTTAGTPTVTSASNINLSVGGSVTVSGGGLRVASLDNTARSSLAAADGEIIYNSTNDQFEIYQQSAWHPLTKGASIFNVGNNGSSDYTFADPENHWFPTTENDPTLYLRRGETYHFVVNASGHPFEIRVSNGGAAYSTGVTNNATQVGTVTFKVPMSAPSTLYYQCTAHSAMGNTINII